MAEHGRGGMGGVKPCMARMDGFILVNSGWLGMLNRIQARLARITWDSPPNTYFLDLPTVFIIIHYHNYMCFSVTFLTSIVHHHPLSSIIIHHHPLFWQTCKFYFTIIESLWPHGLSSAWPGLVWHHPYAVTIWVGSQEVVMPNGNHVKVSGYQPWQTVKNNRNKKQI